VAALAVKKGSLAINDPVGVRSGMKILFMHFALPHGSV
jgi:hypothetical protein